MQRGNKEELRTHYGHQRLIMSSQKQIEYSELIASQISQLDIWSYQNYHVYLTSKNPNHKEVDTFPLIEILWKKKKQVFVPKVYGEELGIHRFTKNSELKNNQWYIPEPTDSGRQSPEILEVAFVPLIVADKKGYRLGYGKGFYDRFFDRCSPTILKIGLGFFSPIKSIENVHSSDKKLDYLITPKKIYKFD